MKSLILILAFFSASAFAQSDDSWYHLNESKNFNFYLKKGSLKPTKDGAKIIQAVYKKEGGTPNFYMIEMKTSDCVKGYGFVYQLTLDGKIYDKLDYVEGGGTIAQEFGDVLCHYIKNQKSV